MPITHSVVATELDDPAAEVKSSGWNDPHILPDVEELPTAETDTTKVLSPDGVGGVAFVANAGSVIIQAGPPTQGTNTSFFLAANSPISSGTYELSFEAVTTAPIDGVTGTSTDIAAAMNAAYGSTIARALPGQESETPNDGDAAIQFIGSLGAAPTADATVSNDTTDGGVSIFGDSSGSAPTPAAIEGQFLIDTTVPAAYQFGPVVNGDSSTATFWQPVWPVTRLSSDDGLSTIVVHDGEHMRIAVEDAPTSGIGNVITFDNATGTWTALEGFGAGLHGETALSMAGDGFSLTKFDDTDTEVAAFTVSNLAVVLNMPTGIPFVVTGLPTTDPANAGQVWSNLGVMMVSAG